MKDNIGNSVTANTDDKDLPTLVIHTLGNSPPVCASYSGTTIGECLHGDDNQETNHDSVCSQCGYSQVSDNVSDDSDAQTKELAKNIEIPDQNHLYIGSKLKESRSPVCNSIPTALNNGVTTDSLELGFDTHDYTYIARRGRSRERLTLDSEIQLSSQLSLNLDHEGKSHQLNRPGTELTFSTTESD